MTAMVERVARAICEAEKMNPDDALGGWIHWQEAAVAAIAAMRDPTNRMIKAAGGAMSPGKRSSAERVSCKEKHRIRYRAMVDAALPSTPSEQESAA